MGTLLETYEGMQKQAEVDQLQQERLDVISKYAEVAEIALKENYGEGGYTNEHIVKVAQMLLDEDIEAEEQMAKVAEFDEAGRIMARSFVDELRKQDVK